jgi:hypothetical protein
LLALAQFDAAADDLLREQSRKAGLDPREAVLVHGITTVPADGTRHGHAWIELGDTVIDVSQSLERPRFIGSKEEYYQLGQIQAQECIRYGVDEALRQVEEHGHSGPWKTLPPDVKAPVACRLEKESRVRLDY